MCVMQKGGDDNEAGETRSAKKKKKKKQQRNTSEGNHPLDFLSFFSLSNESGHS